MCDKGMPRKIIGLDLLNLLEKVFWNFMLALKESILHNFFKHTDN